MEELCSNYRTIALISHASNAQNSPNQASTVRELCCSPWGHKESDTTERLNGTELIELK